MTSTSKARALTQVVPLLVLCLAALSLAALSLGCQSTTRMTRPDADASLSRPNDWLREQDDEASGVLFQIRHPMEPVRVRLQRLETPIVAGAHESWARLWLEATLGGVVVEGPEATVLGGHDALRFVTRVDEDDGDDDDEGLTHELILANANFQTYLLEAWGEPEAMERSARARRDVVASVELPATAQTRAPSPVDAQELEEGGVRLALPTLRRPEVDASWQIERGSNDRLVVALPAYLIEAEVLVEALDYPIDAVTYARTALGVDLGEEPAVAGDVTVRGVAESEGPISMHTTRRFLTRGERAVQIVVSTPEALYETNSDVIDRLVETLEVVEDAE